MGNKQNKFPPHWKSMNEVLFPENGEHAKLSVTAVRMKGITKDELKMLNFYPKIKVLHIAQFNENDFSPELRKKLRELEEFYDRIFKEHIYDIDIFYKGDTHFLTREEKKFIDAIREKMDAIDCTHFQLIKKV